MVQVVHLIFKKWEPMNIPIVSTLLFVVPSSLSMLLVPQLGTIKSIVATFLSYFAVLVLSIVSYRVSPFHPLAQYPGPLLAKITKWWHAYHIYQGKQHLYIQQLHDQYGDVVRIGACRLESAW